MCVCVKLPKRSFGFFDLWSRVPPCGLLIQKYLEIGDGTPDEDASNERNCRNSTDIPLNASALSLSLFLYCLKIKCVSALLPDFGQCREPFGAPDSVPVQTGTSDFYQRLLPLTFGLPLLTIANDFRLLPESVF